MPPAWPEKKKKKSALKLSTYSVQDAVLNMEHQKCLRHSASPLTQLSACLGSDRGGSNHSSTTSLTLSFHLPEPQSADLRNGSNDPILSE